MLMVWIIWTYKPKIIFVTKQMRLTPQSNVF